MRWDGHILVRRGRDTLVRYAGHPVVEWYELRNTQMMDTHRFAVMVSCCWNGYLLV